jgi:histone chaperone ASF1
VGPIPIGVNKFIFEADPPNLSRLPATEILGVTVILLTCSYDGREFVRVGYYVNNEYDNEEMNNEPPAKPIIERIRRNVLAEKPRVTRFAIKWYVLDHRPIFTYPNHVLTISHRDSEESAPAEFPPDQPEADTLDDDGTGYGAEEAEMQAALEQELEETEANLAQKPQKTKTEVDKEMVEVDVEGTKDIKGEDEEEDSDAGSEDLEEESSESEDEEDEEEGAEGEDTEMGDAEEKGPTNTDTNGEQKASTNSQPEVMVH